MKNITIILIDDDQFLSKVIHDELRDAGFDINQAADGEEGLKLVQSRIPDLVLLDILMPKTDGFAVLEAMKKSPATSSIPVIILTSLGEDENIKKGLRLGANDYIVKGQHAVGEIIEKVKDFFAKESHPEGKQPKAGN